MEANQGAFPPGPRHGEGGGPIATQGRRGPEGVTVPYPYQPADLRMAPTHGVNNPQAAPPVAFPSQYMPSPFAPSMNMMNGSIMPAPTQGWFPPAPGSFLMMPENMFNNQDAIFAPVGPGHATEPAVPFDPSSEPPFADLTEHHQPRPHGVIRIKNIPYALTVTEVQQFICKYVHISDLIKPHQDGIPIHIVMERSTGKTMDCYIELVSPEIATEAWERGFSYGPCRFPKLGQRHVIVELSDQGDLMRDLFPRARCVNWDKQTFGLPREVQPADTYSSGFSGFFTAEEMAGVVRHAETPQRSPFASRSLQRTYESMISTLYKFPWSARSMYTMNERDILFKAYARQLEVLIFKVERDTINGTEREVGLDIKLLMDFLFAGMNCVGFSERQKAAIADASHRVGPGLRTSVHARNWPFQALIANPSALSDQDIGMWFEILNLGMVTMERENRGVIGIHPYLDVLRDDKGYLLFKYTDKGSSLRRHQYADMEKHFMREMLHKGWASYMHQAGIAPPPDFDRHYADDSSGSAGGNQAVEDLIANLDDDEAVAREKAEATNRQLASFRELLKVTHGEEYVKTWNGRGADSTGQGSSGEFGPGLELPMSQRRGRGVSPYKYTPTAKHSHSQSLSIFSGSPGKNPSPSTHMNFGSEQDWQEQQRRASESTLDRAFSSLEVGDPVFSPPRISTARKGSPSRQAASHAPGLEGLGPAPVFKVPRRQRQAVSIRAPDGTPVMLRHQTETGNTAEEDDMAPQASTSTTPATGTTPASTPDATPRGPGSAFYSSSANVSVNVNPTPVTMPSVGRPSPGHTRNFGMSSNYSFVAASASSSPAVARGGHVTRVVADSGSPLARGFGAGTGSDSSRPRQRTRARSNFGFGEPINEEFEDAEARSSRRN